MSSLFPQSTERFHPTAGYMPQEHVYQALREHPFTSGLSEEHLAVLAGFAQEAVFAQDQLILLAGERSRLFYLVLSGSVCVEVGASFYTLCIQALGPGEAFGWSSLLNHHDTLFQVRAREESTVICLDGGRLSAACQQDPEFGLEVFRRVLELVAGRVKATESRLGEFCGAAATDCSGRSVAGDVPKAAI
jgi:CRP-like cAMP-binding protein